MLSRDHEGGDIGSEWKQASTTQRFRSVENIGSVFMLEVFRDIKNIKGFRRCVIQSCNVILRLNIDVKIVIFMKYRVENGT